MGTYRGFEDFCVLNARRTDEKYRGSYETSIMKRFTQFANSSHLVEDTERLFTLIALNCALRNGDAHLKNFGIVYDDVQGEARLAPVYDLVDNVGLSSQRQHGAHAEWLYPLAQCQRPSTTWRNSHGRLAR